MKLIVELVELGIFWLFFSEWKFLLSFLFRDTSGIIARIKESLWTPSLEMSRFIAFCFDSLTSTLSSKYPIRGFSPLTLKIPSLYKSMSTFAMRKSALPFSHVCTAIVPCHFTFALSHVLAEISFINITIGPVILTISIFPVSTEMADKLVSIFTYPCPLSFS